MVGMLSPRAILWDMDGVLADTNQLHFKTWEHTLTELDIPFDRQKFHLIYGLKNLDLLAVLTDRPLVPEWVELVTDKKEIAFRQALQGHLFPLPGVVRWLEWFANRGYRQAVASSAPAENVEVVVDELDIRKYFDALVTPGDLPGKPNPAVFLLAGSRLGVPAQQCIVIEDSIPGVEAACRAGMRCIAVQTTNPPEALTQADIVVETLDQLTEEQFNSLF
jgi:HAD superfamily hydrolase (TIGR01509 family)